MTEKSAPSGLGAASASASPTKTNTNTNTNSNAKAVGGGDEDAQNFSRPTVSIDGKSVNVGMQLRLPVKQFLRALVAYK